MSTGRKLARHTVKGLGVIGVFLSAGLAYESYAKGDTVGAIGNSITAIGSFILLFSTIAPPLFIVAIGLVIIGTVISLFSDDEKETWIEHSFWGTSKEYLMLKRNNFTVDEFIKKTQNPAERPSMISNLEKEIAYFMDIISSLRLEDNNKTDNKFEVKCSKIVAEKDLESLTVSHSCYRISSTHRGRFRKKTPDFVENIKKHLISPGEIEVIFDTLKVPTGSLIKFKITIPRFPNGSFVEEIEIETSNA